MDRVPRGLLGIAIALSVAAAGQGLLACQGLDGCPCGSDVDDPLAQHDLSFAGEHLLDGACACRCDGGDLEQWPLDGEGGCDHEDTECENAERQPGTLTCD